jgi:hypothetical protein
MTEYEMTDKTLVNTHIRSVHPLMSARSQGANAALLNAEESDGVLAPSRKHGSKFRDWLRQLKLQFVFVGFSPGSIWNSKAERRKIAMYRSRRMAALHTIFHLIPLGGAITLLVLHWTQYWVAYTFDISTAIQFVAKLHEVLMQASIVEIMLCIVRTEAVRGFVPLGALSGAVQTTQLSYLWSLDFISMITSSTLRGWRRIFICAAIPILFILTALVGPSSAILMIPRPGSQHSYEPITRYFDNSQHFYPARFDATNKLKL